MDQTRRGFFQSFSEPFKQNKQVVEPIRLPYNKDESLFQKECVLCEDKPCTTVCDEEIIKILDDGSVGLNFSKRGCTYCDACLESCPKEVLTQEPEYKHIQAFIKLDITMCMAWQNVICSSCRDVCYDNAIKFLGMLRPEINYDNCTSCGFCLGVCPSNAITATALIQQKEEN